jgi:hypothetical protein
MLGVESNTEKHGCDRGEDQKLEHRNLRYLRPQAHDESSRATDDQKPTNDLTPTDVALLHERRQHFGERLSGRAWWRRDDFDRARC